MLCVNESGMKVVDAYPPDVFHCIVLNWEKTLSMLPPTLKFLPWILVVLRLGFVPKSI